MVHGAGNESAVAGSLEPSINLVVARHGGFPLRSEEQKVCIAVIDNIVHVMGSARVLTCFTSNLATPKYTKTRL
jgi:hypothetical protein